VEDFLDDSDYKNYYHSVSKCSIIIITMFNQSTKIYEINTMSSRYVLSNCHLKVRAKIGKFL